MLQDTLFFKINKILPFESKPHNEMFSSRNLNSRHLILN